MSRFRADPPRRPLRALILLLPLLLGAGVALPPGARADEAAVEAAPPVSGEDAADATGAEEAAEEASGGMSVSEVEEWIEESPVAFTVMALLRYGAALVGLVLLVLAWRRFDRARAGLAPPPVHHPPTVLATAPRAFLLVGAFYVAGLLVGSALLVFDPALKHSIVFQLVLIQLMFLPLAIVVIVRRRRTGEVPARTPGWVLKTGLSGFFLASALVVPAMIVTQVVMTALGRPFVLQGPVEEIAKGGGTALPWVVAFFAVVMAPIAEESVFRGLLYPALRGPNASRGRAIAAAVGVSLVFAAIHQNEYSLLPLFVLALVLTWVVERTNSLVTAMVVHGLWNFSTVLPLLLARPLA